MNLQFGESNLEISEIFCPVCKNKNDRKAVTCKYCGASLKQNRPESMTTTRNTGGLTSVPIKLPDSLINLALIPKDGIAIYAAGASKPAYLRIEKELIIGRKEGESPETFLDLSEMDGFNMGLSRRHAMIRRTESGYEVIDLSSTNGTWMNNKRLLPDKPYKLTNGAQIRFGLLQLLIVFPTSLKSKK
jgi:hypothetical protein